MQEILTRPSCWWKTLVGLAVLLDSCLRRNDGEGAGMTGRGAGMTEGREGIRGGAGM